MDIDLKTAVYFGVLIVAMIAEFIYMKITLGNLARSQTSTKAKISGIGTKLDERNEREQARYLKLCMALVALKSALPIGNPHNPEISKLVDELAKENGVT